MGERMIEYKNGVHVMNLPGNFDLYTMDRDQLRQLLKDGRHALSEQYAHETGKVKQ